MKYYVMRVKHLKDGTTKKSEVMEYDSRERAIAKFHSNLGADMADETLQGSMCAVINGMGGMEKTEYWESVAETEV